MPSKQILNEPLLSWLDTLPHSVPLRANTRPVIIEDKSLGYWIERLNWKAGSLDVPLLLLRVGVIDPTHEIVQDGKSDLASYLHGVVHRLEGDYWNAKYWFRQVRDHGWLRSLSLAVADRLAAEDLTSTGVNLKILKNNAYDPSEFVSTIERHVQRSSDDSDEASQLEHISWIEWQSLWDCV